MATRCVLFKNVPLTFFPHHLYDSHLFSISIAEFNKKQQQTKKRQQKRKV
jgi:hypothetical protein